MNAEAATVDVDELWAKMNSGPKTPTATEKRETIRGTSKEPSDYSVASALDKSSNGTIRPIATSEGPVTRSDAEDMISIKRTYIFAGETITESKLVPKSSAEARLHLQSQSPAPNMSTQKPALRRPKKRTSMFDTKPPDSPSTATPSAAGTLSAGPKLNTVEKSKLDWAGYVDKEGIKDELDGAEKAKEGYLGKMDFLGRMGAKREEEIKGTKGI